MYGYIRRMMYGEESKGCVNYYQYVVKGTARDIRVDSDCLDRSVRMGKKESLRAFADICQNSHSGLWTNPHVDQTELARNCETIRRAIYHSDYIQHCIATDPMCGNPSEEP